MGAVRLLVLGAVLLGVLLMHGSPASAASGCHSAMAAGATARGSMSATAMSAAPSPAARTASAPMAARPTAHPRAAVGARSAARTHRPGATRVGAGRTALVGGSCFATPVRPGQPLPVPAPPAPAARVAAAPPGPPGRVPGGGRLFLQFRTAEGLHTAALTVRVR